MPSDKVFSGKKYNYYGHVGTKREANIIADDLRNSKRRWLVRINKQVSPRGIVQYYIYTRMRKGY